MAISHQEYERRYTAIREMMKKDGIDCILIYGASDDFNRGNIRYLTGCGRGGCCIFPPEGAPIFFTGPAPANSPKLRRVVGALDLLELRETTDTAQQAVKELQSLNKGNRIGIVGMGCIPVSVYLPVKERFGDSLTDVTGIFERLREVKSAEEIEKMRQSAAIADTVYRMLRETIRPGLGEYEIYAAVKKINYEMGCEYSFDLIDAAGATMNMSFFPTMDRLESGGTLFLEITPAYEGYYCQLPVTLPVTEYPPHVREMVSAWNASDKAGRKLLRPGTKVSDVCRVLVDTVKEKGFISPYRPGHAIGLDALDFWSITPDNDRLLEPGMAVAMHASVLRETGGDGCGMGYTYLITETGAERFSKIDLAKELLGESA